ncbi:MAG TPA: hypothetical protein VF486_17050 [Actinomycetes bacterium]
MGRGEILARVARRATHDLREQQNLVALDRWHVGVVEVRRECLVAKDELVEPLHDLLHGGLAAEVLEIAHHNPSLSPCAFGQIGGGILGGCADGALTAR